MASSEKAALGFSVHTGWAAAVLLAGPTDDPQVLARARVALAPETHFNETRFVYHRSQELPLSEARRAIQETTKIAHQHARAAVGELIAAAGAHRVVGSGIGLARRELPALEEILRTHALVHAAEGELFGRALVAGCEAHGVKALTVSPKQVPARAAAALGCKPDALTARLAALGKKAGRPWSADQRLATMLALIVLSERSSR